MHPRREHFDWEDLILQIEDRRVIPVVGPDLITVRDGDVHLPLNRFLANHLIDELRVDQSGLSSQPSLQEVALQYLATGGRPQRIYSRIKSIMHSAAIAPSEPLRRLAAITDFDLFISTTFDGLLARAVNEVRASGASVTAELSYSPHRRIQDLPCSKEDLDRPVVYQILGPMTSSTDYAVTDEDVLEFVNSLQSPERQPKLLFDELRNNHLLFIGCSYADWLSRFFIRTVRNERLSLRNMTETIADDRTPNDPRLIGFLQSCAIDVFLNGGAIEFVEQMHRRWSERRPECDDAGREIAAPSPAANDMKRDAIFLSYASEDREMVKRTRDGLESVGLDCWFDARMLQSGDDWDREIRRNIRNCSMFVPFVSRNSASRFEGYFRKEWRWAIDRAMGMDERFPFILPVAIDDTPDHAEGIPDFFRSKHWHRFEDDRPSVEFLDRARALVRELRMRRAGVQ